MDIKAHLAALFRAALAKVAPEAADAEVVIERPRDAAHGDFACNLALQLAKRLKKNPRQLAEQLIAALPADPRVAKLEVAGAGFINIRLAAGAKHAAVSRVLAEGAAYGHAPRCASRRKSWWSSSPPTPPALCTSATVGRRRSATPSPRSSKRKGTPSAASSTTTTPAPRSTTSPSPCRRAPGASSRKTPAGPPTATAASTSRKSRATTPPAGGKPEDLDAVRKFAVAALRKEQDADLQAFGVKFDVYYLESSLYTDGKVEAAVKALVASGKTYEQEGALWLRTTDYGDDKDRVVRKSDGSYTYFVPDVAYHLTKWQRGFRKVINVQGSDHHSTVTRVRAGLQALNLGIPAGYPDYVLHNLVKVMRGGEEVKISKRAGSYVTVRDLIEWVGRDAVRFFLASRRADSDFVFDVDLARSQSEENPVYYVQYAHARVCSVLRQWGGEASPLGDAPLETLAGEREAALMQRLAEFPELLATAAREHAPHSVAFYLRELAGEFHSYYNAERILVEDEATRTARLALCAAVRQVLANGLALLGVGAPERM